MEKTIEWDDLDLKPIRHLPQISHIYIPERPDYLFSRKLSYIV